MEGERNRKRPLDIDWKKVLLEDDPPLELEVTSTPVISNMGGRDQQPPPRDDISRMTDTQLDDLIARQRRNIATLGPKLPDKGEKLKVTLQRYQDEKERRKNRRLEEVFLLFYSLFIIHIHSFECQLPNICICTHTHVCSVDITVL